MTPEEIVARASALEGQPARYQLGAGGRDPKALTPLDKDGGCDCSGFTLWSLGLHRWTRDPIYLATLGDGLAIAWLDALAIWRDATRRKSLFAEVEAAQPGDLIVYPDRAGAQGHVGIVVELDQAGKVSAVTHCSHGNDHLSPGHAIQRTGPLVFRQRLDTIVCRPKLLTSAG